MTITLQQILDKVSTGKVFSAKFVKKDGSIRTMNCRTGVVKHVKGKGRNFDPITANLIPVCDMNLLAKGMEEDSYRFINYSKLIWIKIEGKTFNFKNK
jgi:hypothetical protein